MVKKLDQKSTTEYILDTSKEYSIYVAQNRAIPSVCDGLKDGQRKMIWLMRNKSEKIKVISLAGLSIQENLFLHGDSSASESISLMAATFCNNVSFFKGIGNFGTRIDPTSWGASRYVYVAKPKYLDELMLPDIDIVPLKENYDGSTLEPKHFLPLIPLVLLNGISGIAVGYSTEILPHKIQDIIDATLDAIDGKKVKNLKPDYAYLNCDCVQLDTNSWEFSGKVSIDGSTVVVHELPPDLSLEKFKERLNSLEDDDKIQNYIDKSSENINVEIRFKRGAIADWSELDVINFLKLKSKATQRLVVLDWSHNAIKQYDNTSQLIKEYSEWRLKWYTVRYQTLLANTQHELKFWRALKLCFDKKLPEKLRTIKDRSELVSVVSAITQKFDLENSQIDKIVDMPSYRWTMSSYDQVADKIQELENDEKKYQDLLAKPNKIKDIYRAEVFALKKNKW